MQAKNINDCVKKLVSDYALLCAVTKGYKAQDAADSIIALVNYDSKSDNPYEFADAMLDTDLDTMVRESLHYEICNYFGISYDDWNAYARNITETYWA